MSRGFGPTCFTVNSPMTHITQLAESTAWPVPILEVQSAEATTARVPEEEDCFVSGTLVVDSAAVPVPNLAVQCGEAGVPSEELVASALF
jgi:hypothetical protein